MRSLHAAMYMTTRRGLEQRGKVYVTKFAPETQIALCDMLVPIHCEKIFTPRGYVYFQSKLTTTLRYIREEIGTPAISGADKAKGEC